MLAGQVLNKCRLVCECAQRGEERGELRKAAPRSPCHASHTMPGFWQEKGGKYNVSGHPQVRQIATAAEGCGGPGECAHGRLVAQGELVTGSQS